MASEVRDSDNLLHPNKDNYSASEREKLKKFTTELHQESKKKAVFSMSSNKTARTLVSDDKAKLRVDDQGTINVGSHAFKNVQIQENIPRKKGVNTTVCTTYVHSEGYQSGQITDQKIAKTMKQQAMHGIPETTIFVEDKKGKPSNLQTIPRSPQGVQQQGRQIWTAKDSKT
ncbi:hypothetical protein QBC44DRAFT_361489 [Cladorrhinum sp. PSN332]|nr:hypothetical protein QBC44DRAFT_361489 [Cladorrhinum sp. PSN332]